MYRPALEKAADTCNIMLSGDMISAAIEILLKYNTRVNYREHEVTSDVIFSEILGIWKLQADLDSLKTEFYSFFKANAEPFPETIETLKNLKAADIKIGILTDVAYGMDNKFSLQDIELLSDYIDIALTSIDVGYRKPNKAGFLKLLNYFDVLPNEMIFVGDEEKDIIGANDLGIVSVLINRSGSVKAFKQDYTLESLGEIFAVIEKAAHN